VDLVRGHRAASTRTRDHRSFIGPQLVRAPCALVRSDGIRAQHMRERGPPASLAYWGLLHALRDLAAERAVAGDSADAWLGEALRRTQVVGSSMTIFGVIWTLIEAATQVLWSPLDVANGRCCYGPKIARVRSCKHDESREWEV
jgi:hypothetical protein